MSRELSEFGVSYESKTEVTPNGIAQSTPGADSKSQVSAICFSIKDTVVKV